MGDDDVLAGRFEAARPRLHAVAFRMLGSHAAADDAVQEAWLRLHRSEPGGIDNLDGWLTTVVSRICLDTLKSGSARREHPVDEVPDTTDPASRIPPSRRPRPTPSAPPSWSSSTSSARPSGWPSCCTTCSGCPSTRSR